MKVFTKYLLTLLLLGIASVVNASEYEIDQKFTSVDALDGQLFAIVNETDAMAIYNVNNQNLAYDSYSSAVAGSAYLWKLHSLANEGVAELENAYAIEAVKADGSSQSLWGMSPLYLNSGAEGGFDGCFVLGNGTQYGTDVLYGGAWEIEYEANVGFALKNVARGGYFAGVNPAPAGADPIYFTFCTLKKVEPAEPVVPLFNDGTYYLLNQATNKYLAAGSSWGTHAVVNQMGLDYILTFNDGQYTIDSQVSNGGNSHFLNGEWNDGAAFDWTFTEVAEGVYTISSGTQYLTVDGEEVHFADLAPNEYAKWTLVSAESRKNEVLAAMQNASVDNPVDISFLIKAAGFNRNDLRNNSWIRSKSGGNMTVAGPNGNLGNYGCEFWNNTFEIYQTIEDLPSGVYELTFDGFGTNGTSVLFIGGTEGAFLNTEGASNFQAALEAIANGEYTGNTTGPVTFVGGDMTFGVRRTSQVSADWTVIDNARLIYYGAASLDTYRTAWEQALEAAQAALDSEDYEIVEGVERTNLEAAVSQYSQVAETQEAYEEAASALINLTNIFKAAQAAYLEFGDAQTQLAACEFRYPYASEEKLAAALEVGEMTIESAEQAQTMAAQLLMLCRQVAESSALLEGVEGSRNLTELILNPNAENGTNGWEFVADEYTTGNVSIMSNEPLTDASGNSDYRYFDGLNWGSDYWNGALQQAITLPAGKYLLTVSGRASSDVMMSVFAGEDEEMIFGEGNTGGLFGNGWNDASVEFELDEESTINIGVHGEASTIHQWMSFTRFRLAQFEGGDINPVIPEPEAPLGEDELIPDFFSICDEGGIPYGYAVKFGTEDRAYPNTYSGGARMFNFAEGGDFTKAIYFREGYVQYGDVKKLALEAGKKYIVHFNSAMWKSSGADMTFLIYKEGDLGNAVLTQTIANTPDVNGSKDAVTGSTASEIEFTPDADGNYILKWDASGWKEVLLANPGVKVAPAAPAEMVAFDWVAGEQGYENAQDLDGVEIALDAKTTMTCAKGTGSTTPKYYTSGSAVRTYGGNVITFKGEGITKIVITGVNNKVTELTPSTGELTMEGIVTTWKGEANEIVLTNETTNQQHIAKLHVVYGGVEEDIEPIHIANTIDDPYTVAQAVELIDAGDALDETVFVKGIISKIETVNEEQDFITYWISDNGSEEGQQFECYKGKTMEGLALADIEVGAEVIVTGKLTKYNTIYEFSAGNTIVAYVAPAKPLFADGKYYILNKGTQKYLAAGAAWGTHAVVNADGLDYAIAFADGLYTLDSNVSNGGNNHFLNGEWNDGAATGWIFTPVEGAEGLYTISNGTNFLTAQADDQVLLQGDATAEAAQWMLKTLDERIAELATATAEAPVNATFLIQDANFGRNDLRKSAWTMVANNQNLSGGDNTNNNAESYHSTFTLSQILANAPAGKYQMTAQGFYRQDGSDNENLPVFYANDKTATFPLKTGSENSMSEASASFTAGSYTIEPIEFTVFEDGQLTVGAKLENNTNLWCIWDNFQLTYLGEVVNPDDPELEAPEGWTNLIANGNLANDNVENYYSKEYPSTEIVGATIVPGAGKNNSRGIVVKAGDDTENPNAVAWDSEFWIKLNEKLPAGSKLHVEFDYKASQAAKASTQAHYEPGNYLHWAMIGDVNFTTEWQHFSTDFEVTAAMAKGDNGNGSYDGLLSIAFNLQEEKSATDYFFDNFGIWAHIPEDISDWTNIIVNSSMEGPDNSCFYVTEQGVGGPYLAPFTAGIGVNGSKAVKVQSADNPANDWDTQFFIRLPYQLPAGTKYKVSFDYKADKAGAFDTQSDAEPGQYIHWAFCGSGSFTTDWQTYTAEGSVPAQCDGSQGYGFQKIFQSIAFNLARNGVATQFIFDNIKFEVPTEIVQTLNYNPAVDPQPYPNDNPNPLPKKGWVNLIDNSNLEGNDNHNFFTSLYNQGMFNSTINDGDGYGGTRGIKIEVGDRVSDNYWENQFWVRLNEPLPAGTKFRLGFNYRADAPAEVMTQAHAEPGDYIHWALLGNLEFDTYWQTFAYEGTISSEISREDKMFQSAAFLLSTSADANNYYFDDLYFEVYQEGVKAEFACDVIQIDFGFETNLPELVKNSGKRRLIYPKDCVEVTVDGEVLKVNDITSVEGFADGRFYVFLEEMLDDYATVEVKFNNPEDWAYRIFYTSGKYEGQAVSYNDDAIYDGDVAMGEDAFAFIYVTPVIAESYPVADAINLPNDIKEFTVVFDKPVECSALEATLDNMRLQVVSSEEFDERVVLVLNNEQDLVDGEYTITINKVYPEARLSDDIYGTYTYNIYIGNVQIDPEAKPEIVLSDELWDATPMFGIPEGYIVNFNGELRTYESTYGSGPRMFQFPEGGDFTHGLYIREGYAQYGGDANYPLYLEAGKKYTINFKSAMWKDNGSTMNFSILTADEDNVVFEQTINNSPNVNGNTGAAVLNATNTTIAFTPENDGYYMLRWTREGFNEVLLANPTVKHTPSSLRDEVVAFFDALENAKQMRDVSADCTENEEYITLNDLINWAEAEYQSFISFSQFAEVADNLNIATKNMREYRKLYLEYNLLAENMLAMYQQYADTKFTQSYVYEVLGWVIDEYAPNGEIREQYNLYYLSNAYNSVKEVVTLAQDMFTEGPSRITMTGYAVLTDRIRQGAETMRTLGIDNENLLWYADNTLDEDDWVVDEMKQSIKSDIYKKLSQPNNDLFDATIDEETGEEITPAYNMNIYVENPNIYKWGTSTDFTVPGWYVEDANVSTGWSNYDSWDIPADAMFSNWGGSFFVGQGIGDLPAGTYTVKFAIGERVENSYTDSYAYVWTNNDGYTASIDYIGQAIPELRFNSNYGVVTIENVVVTDGWMQIGVEAGSGSHLFFNEVQLLLTAPAPGYNYNGEGEVLMGDVNLDGEVTTSDAVATVGIVLEDWEPTYRQFRAADVNYTGNITVSDVVGVVNIALNGYEWYEELARSQSFEQEINYLTQDGNKIGLKNTTEFVAFQMDVTLTDGAMLNGVNLNQRANGLNIRYSRLEGNTYRIMAFSMNMAAITGNEGELLSLDITGNQTVTLSNIEFTDTAARAYALGVNDATGINGIMAGDANADYYTVDGVKNDKMRKGMNVVKTADGKVRKMFVK